ncbi:uroporphyrinogen-III C-methyltransferase [Aquibacillus koreensis]|uniref:Uroporphyrinogen-III C-methyltransferase n=1 Tax=Aquibacillus koreensis TaxID=279446 RepID=A0A9X4AIK7_9BACI|nr:uroporphyrinogen-III C-methyltransferase [Aquibacillus koreensis]MCT2536504.1 uroporphyrinogen-III C-methyltransferase [Aquibacillus koreensis]MDC3419408.1 uroporphyrinogen-III C-methyltransferase [Aquibacillus koreensis]
MKQGKVYLVGGGPGDSKLITVKGREAIEKADVIIYDRLVNPQLLAYAKADCELIFGGKLPKRHFLRQEQLNALLVKKAREGKVVVRLKGGDPGVFGRVGEEAEELKKAGIDYEIVPGITSGIAAPIYAGIPVTHRDYGTSFAMVTAHGKANDGKPVINFESLVGIDTIAFYMGIANLSYISENLIQHGKTPNTPVILLQWGTYGRQQQLEGRLDTIAKQAEAVKFQNPAIILVGDIVKVRDKMSWFEHKPLVGRHILLARTSNQESTLKQQLEEQGAEVIDFPKWKKTPAPIDQTKVAKLTTYNSIYFSSPEVIEDFFEIIMENEIDIRTIQATFYVESVKSQALLKKRGLLAKIEKVDAIAGENGLIVKEKLSYEEKIETKHDIFVTSIKEIDPNSVEVFQRTMDSLRFDTLIYPSSNSVHALHEGLEKCDLEPEQIVRGLTTCCLGNHTKQELAGLGMKVDVMPSSPSVAAFVKAFIDEHTLEEERKWMQLSM